MTKTNVDDYYSNLQKSEDSAGEEKKKKIVVKKKIKLKPKKEDSKEKVLDIIEEIPSQATPESEEVKEENIDIKKDDKKPIYQIISSDSTVEDADKDTMVDSIQGDETVSRGGNDDNDSKSPVKFKAGFGKSTGKIQTKKEKDAEELKRKTKLSPYHKASKYKGSFSDDEGFVRSNKIKSKKKTEKRAEDIKQNLVDRTGQTIEIPDILSLKEFSEKIGIPLPKLIAEFMKNGLMVNMNSPVDFDTATIISEVFDIKLTRDRNLGVSIDEVIAGNISEFLKEDDATVLEKRPPVISIMGHVDHGKTSLLDYIRKEKVAEGEAGGITQSIGAYQVEHEDNLITFLDTPGHEAFTVMRSRGAKSTDIAILVVAADEGVKPQTLESISHAKEAGIPVIVAINKMDKQGANPDYVKGQLSEQGLTPEDWGGDTPMVPVSALTGFGIDTLLEIILLVAEMSEFKANPNRKAVGTVIESHLDTKLGPVATALINTGTINKTDNIVCADAFGKAKILKDYAGRSVKYALPGSPVLIVGLDKVVNGGDILQSVSSPDEARNKATSYKEVMENQKKMKTSQIDMLMMKIKSGNLKQLKVVVKADSNGSLEAIKNSILKLSTPETAVSIIHSGVGHINEGDIHMCQGSHAILVGFNVNVVTTARSILEDSGIEFIQSPIIYHITERIEKIVTGMLDPKEVEVILSEAKVLAIFYTSPEFMIIGIKIGEDQKIEKNAKIRVFRNGKFIGKGEVASLKQGVEEVKTLEGPVECGIKFVGDIQPEEKDILELYKIEKGIS